MSIRFVTALAAVGIAFALAVVDAPAAVERRDGPPIAGGSSAQRALLRQVLRAMGGTQIRRVTISASSGGGVQLVMQPARLDRSHPNLSVRIAWDAYLVTYSFLRLSLERDMRPVAGFSVAGQSRTFRSPEPRALPRFDRSRIVKPVGRGVKRSGATLIEFNLFRPAGPGFAVVIAAARPANFIQHRLEPLMTALNGVATRLDGFYIAVTNKRRSVVFAYNKVNERGSSSTTLYVRPNLLGCAENLPVENEVADGAPPCPRD